MNRLVKPMNRLSTGLVPKRVAAVPARTLLSRAKTVSFNPSVPFIFILYHLDQSIWATINWPGAGSHSGLFDLRRRLLDVADG